MINPDDLDIARWRQAFATLTPRELEAADLLADGYLVSDIVSRRYISEATIKHQIRDVFRKMGVHSQTTLVSIIWQIRYDDLRRGIDNTPIPCSHERVIPVLVGSAPGTVWLCANRDCKQEFTPVTEAS